VGKPLDDDDAFLNSVYGFLGTAQLSYNVGFEACEKSNSDLRRQSCLGFRSSHCKNHGSATGPLQRGHESPFSFHQSTAGKEAR
jgi:hypothetical protein